jgi:hypothetical protein
MAAERHNAYSKPLKMNSRLADVNGLAWIPLNRFSERFPFI